MVRKNLSEWINELIAEDRLEEFYTCRAWRRARAKAFELQHYECQECKRKGRLTLLGHPGRALKPGEVIGIGHHKKPLKLYPELALDVNNIDAVCWPCHNEIEKSNTENVLTEEFW